MDIKITLLKAIQNFGIALAISVLTGLAVVFVGSDVTQAISDLGQYLAKQIPFVGEFAKGIVVTFLTAVAASLSAAVLNLAKHLGK